VLILLLLLLLLRLLLLRLLLLLSSLQVAKVYVSVYSDEAGKERAITNLKRVAP
jgi:hypothetical protein